jgi:tetratricopeptide (TPR) repeat protein
VAPRDPEGFATSYAICGDCAKTFCDRCSAAGGRFGGSTCRLCGGALRPGNPGAVPQAPRHLAEEFRHHDRGLELARAGQLGAALTAFDDAVRLRPGYVEAHFGRGMALRELGRFDEARVAFEEVIRLDPLNALAFFDLAGTLRKAGRPDEAIAAYDRAVALDPSYVDPRINKAHTLDQVGRREEALAVLEEAVVLDPDNAFAHSIKGMVLIHLGREVEAVAAIREALRLRPDGAEDQRNLAYALKRAGRRGGTNGERPLRGTAAEGPEATADVPLMWHEGDVILGLYRVIGLAGKGGMGVVYRVRHLGWDLDLAMKAPRPELCATQAQVREFERECEAWVALGVHPHTVSCAYVRRLGGVPRVFAEWVDGGSLAQWVQQRRLYAGGTRDALRRILDVAIQFAWGLEHAHDQAMIHQDVKPANVMLTHDGIVKVTDFGLAGARIATGADTASQADSSLVASRGGMTPAYCSPEQASPGGDGRLTRATDVWSWAISVLELFVGEPPCRYGQTAGEVFAEFVGTGPRDPAIPALPAGLAALLGRCFRPDPADRPGTMAEIAEALIEVYEDAVGEPWQRPRPDAASMLADGLSNQALSLLDLGRTEQAEALFERALRSDPLNPHAIYNRGLHRWRSGRASDAPLVAELEAVRASRPADPIAAYLLGLVHLERGDRDAARAVLADA